MRTLLTHADRNSTAAELRPLVAVVAGCLALVTGCAMPGKGTTHQGKVPRVANVVEPPAMQQRVQQSVASTPAPLAGQTLNGNASSIGGAYASVTDSVPASVVPASATPAPVTQVAYTTATPCASGCCGSSAGMGQAAGGQVACGGCSSCAENCNGCALGCRACKPQQPFGYAMPCGPLNMNCYNPQEYICDGGDHPPEATLRRDDTIDGLQPEDTVVHYTTQAGTIEFDASNRVCLYAPRFKSVRKITGALAGGRAIGAVQVDRPTGPIRVEEVLPGLVMTDTVEICEADVARRIDAMRERNRGVPIEGVQQPIQAVDVLAALVGLTVDEILLLQDEERALLDKYLACAVVWTIDESVEVAIADVKPPTLIRDEHLEGFTIYEFPDGKLRICKLADKADALPGEIVNFAIRVENVGDAPVDHVVLTDNLTTRLEYVEGSQTCSGGAVFDTFENDGQSLRLEWKLTDQLRVGESVTMRFQCRVR